METTTPIEVLAKNTEEVLRQKNAEFLAKYPTDAAQIDYYTQLAMQVFEEFQIDGDYTEEGVRTNVAMWFNNKRAQMDRLRKHQYWNEEAKAVVFAQNEQRPMDYYEAYNQFANLLTYVKETLKDSHYDPYTIAAFYTLDSLQRYPVEHTGKITERFIRDYSRRVNVEEMPKALKRMLVVGTKITKFVHKCFSLWTEDDGTVVNATILVDEHDEGDRSYQSFDKIYAKFADALSELTIKKITLISLHFCDFMTMSNGNSWSSCHYINSHNIFHEDNANSYRGCYKQGCLSYALDEPSFLLYTLPGTYDGEEYYRQPKINRMCCQYNDGVIITGKCYPRNEDAYITRYRQIIQLVMSTVEDIPNLWTFSRKINKVTAFAQTAEDAGHYEDYTYEDQKPTISFNKNFVIDIDKEILIGHEAYCLCCGTGLSNDERDWLQCRWHRKKRICKGCGRRIGSDDELVEIGDDVYCKDCSFYCHYHRRWELNCENVNYLTLTNGDEVSVCNDAMDNYFCCPHCGKYAKVGSGYQYTDGALYCKDCFFDIIQDGEVQVIKQNVYQEGQYVLMADKEQLRECSWGSNGEMLKYYPGRVARITNANNGWSDYYNLTINNPIAGSWGWDAKCIAGAIYGIPLNDSVLGKTLEEIENER